MKPAMHHIPICPFSQRVEILLALKGATDAVDFHTVDITVPRDANVLALTGGTTALPVLDLGGGRSLKESLVLLEYFEDALPTPAVRRTDPYKRAVEHLLVSMASSWIDSGYAFVMNQDPANRERLRDVYLQRTRAIDEQLRRHNPDAGPWLFDDFGWAEVVFTPFFQRFTFIAYYEGIDVPEGPEFERLRAWRDACVAHPSAQQVTDEEIIKLYYDYARGAGNGALPGGRTRSSFVFEPHWRERPMPPKDKYSPGATDAALGLV